MNSPRWPSLALLLKSCRPAPVLIILPWTPASLLALLASHVPSLELEMVPLKEYCSPVGTSIVRVPAPTCRTPAPPETPRTVWSYEPRGGGVLVGSSSCRRKIG